MPIGKAVSAMRKFGPCSILKASNGVRLKPFFRPAVSRPAPMIVLPIICDASSETSHSTNPASLIHHTGFRPAPYFTEGIESRIRGFGGWVVHTN